MGRGALRPDAHGVARRAGAVRDGLRPPRSGARKACVLDGSEHRAISPAVNGGLRGLSAPLAPPFGALGVPFSRESDLPGLLDGLQPRQLRLRQLREAS